MEYLEFDKNICNSSEYKDMIETMAEEVKVFYDEFEDDYNKLSGWGHNYFCHEDGGKLIFDIHDKTKNVCEICGKNYEGDKYDEVWVYNYRNVAIQNIVKSAFLYRVTGEEVYLNSYKDILGYYADNYTKFQLHDKTRQTFDTIEEATWGCGRILPQGLNESIFVIKALQATEMLKNDLDKEFLDNLYTNFFKEVANVLIPQVDKIHNIICWNNCAIGSIGLFFDDKELIAQAFDKEFNVRDQLNTGVTEDYFWYEGSIHYNFFTLEGFTNLLLFSKLYDYDFGKKEEEIIAKMLLRAYDYAFTNHSLPNPNDGWPNINLKTYSFIYATGAKIFGEDSEVANIYKNIVNGKLERGTLPLSRPYYFENRISLERIMLDNKFDFNNYEPVVSKSTNFPSSQYGILKNDNVNVFLKYGHRGPSHAHFDKMNIEVVMKDKVLTKDLSNAGYGANICKEWHRVSASHNTVVVNGENHISMENGEVLEFNENLISACAKDVYGIKNSLDLAQLNRSMNSDEVYSYVRNNFVIDEKDLQSFIENEGDLSTLDKKTDNTVDFCRTIELTEKGYKDEFIVKSSKENNCDYIFHYQAKLLTEVESTEADLGYKSNGYQHIKNVRLLKTNNEILELTWDLDGDTLVSQIDTKNKEVYLADTYDNPINNLRTALILREKSDNCKFNVNNYLK